MRFTLPDRVTEQDRRKLDILSDLAIHSYTGLIPAKSVLWEDADGELLQNTAAALDSRNCVYVSCKERCSVSLFGVKIDFGYADVLSGPYRVDAEDLRKKLQSYCEGDIRKLRFTAESDVETYLIRDMDTFRQEQAQHYRDNTLKLHQLPLILDT